MKTHTMVGARMLSGSRFGILQTAEDIALTHHERWDGRGYFGLSRDTIPLTGRIVAVADVFDALTHDRPYKTAWSEDAAVAEIVNNAGTQFDPKVVDAFCKVQSVHALPDPPEGALGPSLPDRDIILAASEELRAI